MSQPFVIEKATSEDSAAILDVMRPWNMHHVPSPEMEELDVSCFFVARIEGRVIGAGGYKIASQSRGKTTLLGVLPQHGSRGIGGKLQEARLDAMAAVGVKVVTTNADRPETIRWYKDRFGYREVGVLKKLHDFGDPHVDHWTTLELDLQAYAESRDRDAWQRRYVSEHEAHPLAPYPPLLINACVNGMVPTRDLTPFVPVTVDEIVEDAVKVADAGAQLVHIHARDDDGSPTWKASIYESIIAGIRRERPGLICCVSCSGRNWSDMERRAEVLHLTGPARPDMASLTLGSMNFLSGASVNAMDTVQDLARIMQANGIVPELEAFDVGMVGFARYLERKRLLPRRKYFNLLLGNLSTAPATIGSLDAMVQALPEHSVWAAAGLGVFQLPMNVAAIIAGGGVRVGIEDAIHFDFRRTKLATNVQLVERLVRIAGECQRPVASTAKAREMIGIAAVPGS